MTTQVFEPPYCTCRVYKDRGGDVEIVSTYCEIHGGGGEPDKLVSALPLKSDIDRQREFEEAAESLLTPLSDKALAKSERGIFKFTELDTPEVRELYRGRYGR